MDESITKEISIEGVSSRDLFGTHGAYLERMAALSPRVKIVARGDTVKVLGSKADVEAFERKMREGCSTTIRSTGTYRPKWSNNRSPRGWANTASTPPPRI